jgi:hypothetical protein
MRERRGVTLGLMLGASLASYVACGGDDTSTNPDPDASVSDANGDSGGDAPTNPSDTGVSDSGSNRDAGICVGASCGGELLVGDSAQGKIYLIDTAGSVKKTITAPFTDLAGITFDSRDATQIWIARLIVEQPMFYRLDFDGNVTSTRDLFATIFTNLVDGGMYGLTFREAADASDDFLLCNLDNSHQQTLAQIAAYPDASSAGGFIDPFYDGTNYVQGVWGLDIEGNVRTDDFGDASRWVTRDIAQDAATLEHWSLSPGPALSSTQLPTTHALGMALTPEHEFYVVDAEHSRILHLGASGAVLNVVTSPSPSPAGLSYRP